MRCGHVGHRTPSEGGTCHSATQPQRPTHLVCGQGGEVWRALCPGPLSRSDGLAVQQLKVWARPCHRCPVGGLVNGVDTRVGAQCEGTQAGACAQPLELADVRDLHSDHKRGLNERPLARLFGCRGVGRHNLTWLLLIHSSASAGRPSRPWRDDSALKDSLRTRSSGKLAPSSDRILFLREASCPRVCGADSLHLALS